MSTRWERLSGDTSVFAFKVAFAPDPDSGQGADPEVGLSWGSFQIWVEGKNLCAHQEEGERIDSVHWYLLPLFEWLARHWNALLHEERVPAKNEGDTGWESLRATRFPPPAIEADEQHIAEWEMAWQTWWARHALRAARQGGLFPDVVLRRWRDSLEISWGPTRGVGMPQHFDFTESEQGVGRLPPQAIATALHEVLSSASEYLLSLAPESGRLRTLNRTLRGLTVVSRHREQRLMWLAGLGIDHKTARVGWKRAKRYLSDLAEVPRKAMLEASETALVVTGSCQAALMFGSLAPDVTRKDVLSLARALVELHSLEGEVEPIWDICRPVALDESESPAWSQGYDLAEELHDKLADQFLGGDFVDIEGIVHALGVSVRDVDLSDAAIRGVSVSGPQHRPGIIVNSHHAANTSSSGRRFTLAHELCHLLFDRESGRCLAIASGPWAPRDIERRANAFAAMLLMPIVLVQRVVSKLGRPLDTEEGVSEVAAKLRASFFSALRHLTNLGFIDEVAQQRIENASAPPTDCDAPG